MEIAWLDADGCLLCDRCATAFEGKPDGPDREFPIEGFCDTCQECGCLIGDREDEEGEK